MVSFKDSLQEKNRFLHSRNHTTKLRNIWQCQSFFEFFCYFFVILKTASDNFFKYLYSLNFIKNRFSSVTPPTGYYLQTTQELLPPPPQGGPDSYRDRGGF